MCKKKAIYLWDGNQFILLTIPAENGRKCQESLYSQNPIKPVYLCEDHLVDRLIW
jgi:hypothetical protein